MAWTCQKCLKRIYKPRDTSRIFVLEYKYVRSRGNLSLELENLANVKEKAVIMHLNCDDPEVPGIIARIRAALKIPKNAIHPLLD